MTGRRPIALVPLALVMLLASCGGGGSSKHSVRVNGATGAGGSGAAASSPYSATPSPARHRRGAGKHPAASRSSASLAAPRAPARGKIKPPSAPKRKSPQSPKQKTNPSTAPGGGPSASPSPSALTDPQEVLGRKAKRVCQTLGLGALAAKYHVRAMPEAVATAYAASYPATLRTAVHDGCLAGFAGR